MALLTSAQLRLLEHAVADAERGHRGEVRVHVEARCKSGDPLARAGELFEALGMRKTADDTGVLLYVALGDRACAVFAGEGIHGAEGPAFWQEVVDCVARGFEHGDPIAGLEMALLRIGELLRVAASGEDRSGDELPNRVSLG